MLKDNSQKKIPLLFELSLWLPLIKILASTFFPRIYSFFVIALYLFIILLLFNTYKQTLFQMNWKDFVYFAFLIVSFFISFFYSYCDKQIVRGVISDCLLTGLIGFIATRFIKEDFINLNRLRFEAYICSVCFALSLILHPSGHVYSMNQGYYLLSGFIILTIPMSIQYYFWDFVFSIVYFVLIFACGTRGPLLIAGLLFISVLFSSQLKGKKLVYVLLFFSILVISLLFIDEVFSALGMVLGSSFSTRLISKITSKSFLKSNDRIEIYVSALNYCIDHPIIGCGISNDRVIIAQSLGIEPGLGTYPHNLPLEWCMQFGLIPGIVIISYFCYLLIRSSHKVRNCKKKKAMLRAFFFDGVLSLMISRSYLLSFSFFALIGLILNVSSSKNLDDIRE